MISFAKNDAMKQESVNWDYIDRCTDKKREQFKRIEHVLRSVEEMTGEKLAKEIGLKGSDGPRGSMVRRLQDLIKEMNENVYISGPKITRSPHKLNRSMGEYAFPEDVFSIDDRKLLTSLCKLVAFFDGAVPIKSVLRASNIKQSDIREIFNEFSENIDVPSDNKQIEAISMIYEAINNRQLISITYPPLNDEKLFAIAPYCLKRHNNKWFLIGRVYNDKLEQPFDWTSIPLMGITRITTYNKGGYQYLPSDVTKIKELKNRIHRYYEHVVGFDVRHKEKKRDKLTRHMDVEDLDFKKIRIRVLPNKMRFIKENPIHLSQIIDEEKSEVILNVVLNIPLKQRILTFGDEIEVLEPEEFREEIVSTVKNMAKLYDAK